MKRVTSVTLHTTGEGMRMSITYSEVNEIGKIIESNKRANRVVDDSAVLEHIAAIESAALDFANTEG